MELKSQEGDLGGYVEKLLIVLNGIEILSCGDWTARPQSFNRTKWN